MTATAAIDLAKTIMVRRIEIDVTLTTEGTHKPNERDVYVSKRPPP